MRLLRYAAVIWPQPRRLAPVLAGLTVGAVLAGTVVALEQQPSGAPAGAATDVSIVSVAPTREVAAPDDPSSSASDTGGSTREQRPAARPPGTAAAGPAAAVVAATNDERTRGGCPRLRSDPQLTTAAQAHATDMAATGYFSHTGRDGRSFSQRALAAGYPRPGGENIAYGQPDAASVVRAWMNSAGHRANILNCSFTSVGVGFDGRGDYWVQNFGF